MTSSGKVRIYELSRDLGLENKDVLDAAEQLGVAAKSHSSSISDDEASRIRRLLDQGSNGAPAQDNRPAASHPVASQGNAILTVKKAAPAA
ncbi:MAG: translation initiation factor IF-2 N-terminal domain-containing protein, partial [Cyanobium sp.]